MPVFRYKVERVQYLEADIEATTEEEANEIYEQMIADDFEVISANWTLIEQGEVND